MCKFFQEKVLQPRFPRSVAEGVLKGFLLGGMIMGPYDLLLPYPKTITQIAAHSRHILNGYALFVVLGAVCGLIGQYCLEEERPGARFNSNL